LSPVLPIGHPDDAPTVSALRMTFGAAISVSEVNAGSTEDNAIEALTDELAARVDSRGDDWRGYVALLLIAACGGCVPQAHAIISAAAELARREDRGAA
jgi:hypothetical protein